MIKVGNDSFLQTKFGPKASETISQRRFLLLQSQFGPKASETIWEGLASSAKISSNIQTLQLLGARRSCGKFMT